MDPKSAVRLDRSVGRQVYFLHRWIYRATRGRVGHRTSSGPVLLLRVRGRRTGQVRTKALLYMPDGEDLVVVGSNGGRPRAPEWLLNLEADPEAEVQVGSRRARVKAEVLSAEGKKRLWPRLTAHYPGFAHYETLTDRELRAVVLHPG